MSASHARVALADGEHRGQAFARRYVHAGMVRLDGEKMSKSLGNLVFVSSLLAGGSDPMAVRLAILAHRYAGDWDWTAAGLAAATERLGRWRAAVRRGLGAPDETAGLPAAPARPAAEAVLATVRERMADDLDAPGALAAVDHWAHEALSERVLRPGSGASAALVRDTVDALLGVRL
jgi:L-cysteine:1D-myo-inositol 2-amino-2-deoxy-alpha-D-glucopyranoside ligase